MAKKLPAESFDYYLSLGVSRSYQAVAEHFGVSKRAVTRRAAVERWNARVLELEAKARQAAADKALESLEAVNLRHLKALRVIQGKALETLRAMPLNTAMEAVRALDASIRQERLILGEPSERTAVSIEDTIRREYERWMVPEEENDGEEASSDEVQ
jgi:hypothetical protein